jgi:hypothetical protein
MAMKKYFYLFVLLAAMSTVNAKREAKDQAPPSSNDSAETNQSSAPDQGATDQKKAKEPTLNEQIAENLTDNCCAYANTSAFEKCAMELTT